ncbi:MAG: PD-(D/E)XK nuclease family protein [Betaproteobacteria bacterium]|nr:PD-(D/E)XK nuclease family protein [Betaproteobacteria bacterium]MDH3436208.1 PD-(D/E)XK nuclease family protein [Betaproteobacteria bacterium]
MHPDLAQRIEPGCVVVTPNRRLAAYLKREYDARQVKAGKSVWPTADILPFSAFVERAYGDALYSSHAAGFPILLSPAQEQALWESIIRDSEMGKALLAVPETAALARKAWQLAHAWRLMPRLGEFPLNEDGRAFQQWARRYESITRRERHTDSARLADVTSSLLTRAEIRKPKALFHYGFDLVMLQQAALFEALAAAGCEVISTGPEPRSGDRRRVAHADSGEEIRRAAAWARARLESNGAARIGIVVPELAKHRKAVQRIFSAVMEPDYALPGSRPPVFPFNISLGEALSSYPLVNAAFLVLELAGREIDFERASRLIRSPFLAGAHVEQDRRARLDAWLRKRAEPVITLDRLLALVAHEDSGCPVLAQRLSALSEFRKARLFGGQPPSAWARGISEALALVGFPGERSLDSNEFQTLAKWHEAVADLAALDLVLLRTGYTDAVSQLRRTAADALFLPETPEVPIQILGELEATGMEFDHLWVMGLSDDAWPHGPRPNAFLPVELQRAAGIPQGSAAESLELARRLTGEWLSCAGEVVLSYPLREDDREFKPSPLIVTVPEQPLPLPVYASYRDAVHGLRKLERGEDARAPALGAVPTVGGGTVVIRDHAACPFRALARHRLGAESLEAPHAGLDAMERGTLVHRVLAQAWAQLKTRSALDKTAEADICALLARAAEEAVARIRRERPTVLSGRFAEIEKQRLARRARAWLEVEKQRGGFTVLATEDKRRIEIGGLALNARLDRVDQTDDGRRVVIDYKTGAASPGAMLGERPDEPQLPLYVVGAEPDVAAVAFAQVKAGEMRFAALARDDDLLPDTKAYSETRYRDRYGSWQEMLVAWRADLASLASGFAAGDARVDPKHYPETCRYCDVKPFCRVYERLENALDEEAE